MSERLPSSVSTSCLVITGSFSCSTQDHIRLHRTKGSLSPHILSQAPSREFSSFYKEGKKKENEEKERGGEGRERGDGGRRREREKERGREGRKGRGGVRRRERGRDREAAPFEV